MKKPEPGFKRSIDLIELSDAFRRHAEFRHPKTVKKLVAEARVFAATLTYYYSEAPNLPENRRVIAKLQESLQRMAPLARALGADEVVLPVAAASIDGRMIEEKVAQGADKKVRFVAQTQEYNKDLAASGKIDKRVKTVLDEGYRGFAMIAPELTLGWGQ